MRTSMILSTVLVAAVVAGVAINDAIEKAPIQILDAIPIENLRPARLTACPSDGECDGGYKQVGPYCLCYTTSTDPVADEVEDVETLPASQQFRLIGCCEGAAAPYSKTARWISIIDPVGTCLPLYGPTLFSDAESGTLDLGHADLLNDICCDSGYFIATPGAWGECPECTFACNPAGNPYTVPGGCDSYCVLPEGPP